MFSINPYPTYTFDDVRGYSFITSTGAIICCTILLLQEGEKCKIFPTITSPLTNQHIERAFRKNI